MSQDTEVTLGRFEKYIYVWIILCGVAGLGFGHAFVEAVHDLNRLIIGSVSLLITVLIFQHQIEKIGSGNVVVPI